nr:integrase family protein [Methylobacterium sp. L1A1]
MAGAERGGYGRERTKLTQAHVKRAKGLIASEGLEGRGFDFVDTACQGLVLRVTRRSGTWLLKRRTGTVTLGDMDSLPVASARVAAEEVRSAERRGLTKRMIAQELDVFSRVTARGIGTEQALDIAFTKPHPDDPVEMTDEERRRHGPWEWGDLVDLFLEMKLPTLKGRWKVQYERHLRRTLDDGFGMKLVQLVDLEDLVKMRDRVTRKHTLSAAADSVEVVKAALDWAWRHHAPRAGLTEVEFPWWRERLTVEYSSGTREHTPTIEELARTLVLAERFKALGGTAKETGPGILAALWAVVLTGQRATALTGTLRETTRDWPERPGWKIWTWTAVEMKGSGRNASPKQRARPHALPVPPEALAVLDRIGAPREGKYLFPSVVPGKRTTAVGMTQAMDRLKGKKKKGRNGGVTLRPEDDLLTAHGIRHWTPHDVRRTLPTFLDMERLGGAGSAIMAHARRKAQGGADEERELAQAITLRHYIHSQRLELKAEGMAVWVKTILEAVDQERARLGA